MPIQFSDNHICEKCHKSFEWNYYEITLQNIFNQTYFVDTFPKEKTLAHYCRLKDVGQYIIQVNCPHCNYDNQFDFINPCDVE